MVENNKEVVEKKDLCLSREDKNAIQCVLNCRRYKRNLDVPV